MRTFVVILLVLSLSLFAVEFSVGVFEYSNGPSMFAKFGIHKTLGPIEVGITHWIFWKAWDFGFYGWPNRITPYQWASLGGWWDPYIRINFNDSVYFLFKHRSEHNFDNYRFLNIHWYNFFELGFKW